MIHQCIASRLHLVLLLESLPFATAWMAHLWDLGEAIHSLGIYSLKRTMREALEIYSLKGTMREALVNLQVTKRGVELGFDGHHNIPLPWLGMCIFLPSPLCPGIGSLALELRLDL